MASAVMPLTKKRRFDRTVTEWNFLQLNVNIVRRKRVALTPCFLAQRVHTMIN